MQFVWHLIWALFRTAKKNHFIFCFHFRAWQKVCIVSIENEFCFVRFMNFTDFAHPQANRLRALSQRMHREKHWINAVVELLPPRCAFHIFTCARNSFPAKIWNFHLGKVRCGKFFLHELPQLQADAVVYSMILNIFQRKTCTKNGSLCFCFVVWYVEGKPRTLGSFWFSSDGGLFWYCFASSSICSRTATWIPERSVKANSRRYSTKTATWDFNHLKY